MANKMTQSSYDRLKSELEYLTVEGMAEIGARIKEAKSHGDLSENSEYDEAKNDQAKMKARIDKITAELKDVQIIDESEIDTTTVSLGVTVRLFDVDFDEEVEYKILGQADSDPDNGVISDQSPVGKALLGAAVGDTVQVNLPSGSVAEFKVLDIFI